MKIIIAILVFFLPWHAFLVTVFKCKYGIDTNVLRFWKEILLTGLVIITFFGAYKKHHFSLKKLYHKNTLLGLTTAFIFCSAIYMYFPFFELKAASVLGFRYDAYFLIAFLVGLYYTSGKKHLGFFLKTLFVSSFLVLFIFLPWYLSGDISTMAERFGYSSRVSTYEPSLCLAFAQNVEGQHRLQATFGGPIRFSVFFTIIASLFAGWILSLGSLSQRQKYSFLALGILPMLIGIFFSYSKTSLLGFLFAGALFSFLSYKYIFHKKTDTKFYTWMGTIISIPIGLIVILKWDMFLHLGAVVNRLDNLSKSWEMFFYNPIGYGLGIAGPASQIGNSIESAGNWQIATSTVRTVHRFLPENWYVQILLEQGIIGFALFSGLIILIGWRLIHLVKRNGDFLSVGIATAYFSLCFMALFTHAFEEAATSYILFLFVGIVLAPSIIKEQSYKTKKQHK